MFQNVNELPQLQQMLDEGYIYIKQHQTTPLLIYNYTAKAQYTRTWNGTTMACRGLITDIQGNVVSRPFSKFFNLEEVDTLPDEPFTVSEKMDGSLAISYWVDGQMYVATRGSFDSPQSQWANEWLKNNMSDTMLCSKYTYLFEILCPESRVVVHYGDRQELVLLAVIETATGKELPIDCWGFSTPRFFSIGSIKELAAMDWRNFEGFVVRFESGMRVKVKLAEYVRLHRLISGINEKYVLDALTKGDDIDQFIAGVPDELYNWVKETADKFRAQYQQIEGEAISLLNRTVASTRREYAEAFKQFCYPPILFAMLDGKDHGGLIWKQVGKSL